MYKRQDFLKEIGGKEECENSAEVEEDKKPVVEDVKVDGDTATAVVIDEDRSTLKFVKEGDEWLASGVEAVEKGAGKAGSDEAESSPEEPEPTPDASGGGDETDARRPSRPSSWGHRTRTRQCSAGFSPSASPSS